MNSVYWRIRDNLAARAAAAWYLYAQAEEVSFTRATIAAIASSSLRPTHGRQRELSNRLESAHRTSALLLDPHCRIRRRLTAAPVPGASLGWPAAAYRRASRT
jgi:hypothetical protein